MQMFIITVKRANVSLAHVLRYLKSSIENEPDRNLEQKDAFTDTGNDPLPK